eukprot:scaffold670195_cov38-Prasinocladus_malaysianus.AAC.1
MISVFFSFTNTRQEKHTGPARHLLDPLLAALKSFSNDREWAPHLQDIQPFLPASPDAFYRLPAGQNLTCAIVGNHGNLARSRYGRQIDAHSIVVRMNRLACETFNIGDLSAQGPTRGYERQVGSRTTFRVLNKSESR